MYLLFQIVTAIFYVNMDVIMISQFVYYKLKNQKMTKCKVFQQLKYSSYCSTVFTLIFTTVFKFFFFFQRDKKIECTNSG